MRKALITGSSGFVGSYFAQRLVPEEYEEIDGVDIAESPFTYFVEDCREFFNWANPGEYDLIIHCAAVVGGRLTIDGDPIKVATDLSIDAEFFNWVVKSQNKKQKVVYFSSSAVYPTELQTRDRHIALSEGLVVPTSTRISRPDMTYGWAKLTGEYLAHIAAERHGTDVVIYRPFSGYGEGQSLDYPFPALIKRILDGGNPLTVWGSGAQLRDFVHIDDIVECVLSTMGKLKPGEALNIGSGTPISFFDLAKKMGAKKVINDVTKPEGVFARYADTYKLSKLFTPKVSLEEGIKRVAEHLTRTTP